jgi:hypothetical protein
MFYFEGTVTILEIILIYYIVKHGRCIVIAWFNSECFQIDKKHIHFRIYIFLG